MIYGFAFTWLFITIGLLAGNAQAAQGMALIVFPLTFVSSAYVPIDTMPGWMQAFARNQPITPMVDAVRSLVLGRAAQRRAHRHHRPTTWWCRCCGRRRWWRCSSPSPWPAIGEADPAGERPGSGQSVR